MWNKRALLQLTNLKSKEEDQPCKRKTKKRAKGLKNYAKTTLKEVKLN